MHPRRTLAVSILSVTVVSLLVIHRFFRNRFELRAATRRKELRRLAVAQGMRTMLREAMQLVEDDVTTVPEVVRTLFAH